MFKIRHISGDLRLGLLDIEQFSVKSGIQDKRQLEQEGARFLLENIIQEKPVQVTYDEYGKPHFSNRTEKIAISHSHKWLGVCVNQKEETGLDIELIKEKIKVIAPKFVNDKELEWAYDNEEFLTLIWAAKESVYKFHGRKRVDFKNHIVVSKPQSNNEFIAKFNWENFSKEFLLKFEIVQGYMLTYILNEIK
ncbi:MAG: 4'-phosphopantetheinyl transferase superfamily protein [Bacteroidia bacterium]